ncbi:hypothetical protein M3Y99_01409300 [Aphelenchoides fujianensis]|nr:hypothetical protein M3Y99_01409300 [Aphelenchoides fujianensis]
MQPNAIVPFVLAAVLCTKVRADAFEDTVIAGLRVFGVFGPEEESTTNTTSTTTTTEAPTGDPNCRSKELAAILDQAMGNATSLREAMIAISAACEKEFGGTRWNVICGVNGLDYLIYTWTSCMRTVGRITCLATKV